MAQSEARRSHNPEVESSNLSEPRLMRGVPELKTELPVETLIFRLKWFIGVDVIYTHKRSGVVFRVRSLTGARCWSLGSNKWNIYPSIVYTWSV